MDSMRSLKTSLPKERLPDMNQAFRLAALSVTNLYKAALADSERARSEGYQEALHDLLSFLDKQNVSAWEGDGRMVRQWTSDRLDGPPPKASGSDSDDEYFEDKRARSSSPVMEHSIPEETCVVETTTEPSARSDSALVLLPPEAAVAGVDTAPQTMFHFPSPQPFPSSLITESSISDQPHIPRKSKKGSARSSSRKLQLQAAQNLFQLGNGAGQKRKAAQDYFNIDSSNDRRDGSSDRQKRGRT